MGCVQPQKGREVKLPGWREERVWTLGAVVGLAGSGQRKPV